MLKYQTLKKKTEAKSLMIIAQLNGKHNIYTNNHNSSKTERREI